MLKTHGQMATEKMDEANTVKKIGAKRDTQLVSHPKPRLPEVAVLILFFRVVYIDPTCPKAARAYTPHLHPTVVGLLTPDEPIPPRSTFFINVFSLSPGRAHTQ